MTQPLRWSDDALSSLFGNEYTKTIPSYYPYESVEATSTGGAIPTRLSTTAPTPVPRSGGVPKWVAPVLGVVLGLMAITALFVGFILYRRRQYIKRRGSTSDTGTTKGNRYRIMDWIQYPPIPTKAETTTTEDTSDSSGATVVGSASSEKEPVIVGTGLHVMHEAAGTPIAELPGMYCP